MALAPGLEELDPSLLLSSDNFVGEQLRAFANGTLELPSGGNNEVSEVTHSETDEHHQSTLTRSLITMSDGVTYDVITALPKSKSSNVAIVGTPPLGIPVNHAHSTRTLEDLVSLDFPVLMVGPPSGWNASSNPANASSDIHKILDMQLPKLEVNNNQILVAGGSRGGIIGLGMCVKEYSGKRDALYADLVSPCGPRPPKLKEWPEVLAYAPKVFASLGSSALMKALKGDISDLRNLVSAGPTQPVNSARFFFNVALSGVAGKFAVASDPDTHMHVGIFKDDVWSPADSWRLAFQERANVLVDIEHGGHADVNSSETRQAVFARFSALREARGLDGTLTHAEWLEVMQAHIVGEVEAKALGALSMGMAA